MLTSQTINRLLAHSPGTTRKGYRCSSCDTSPARGLSGLVRLLQPAEQQNLLSNSCNDLSSNNSVILRGSTRNRSRKELMRWLSDSRYQVRTVIVLKFKGHT